MKKLLLTFALLATTVIVRAADERFMVPLDVNGIADSSLKSAGVNNCLLVTSTTPALATDADGNTMTNGFIHWIIIPGTSSVTDAAGPFLVMRSTNTANATSALLTPPIWALENGAGTAGAAPQSQVVTFDPPIPFENGLSVNMGPAGTTPGSNQSFSIGLRWKRRQ